MDLQRAAECPRRGGQVNDRVLERFDVFFHPLLLAEQVSEIANAEAKLLLACESVCVHSRCVLKRTNESFSSSYLIPIRADMAAH